MVKKIEEKLKKPKYADAALVEEIAKDVKELQDETVYYVFEEDVKDIAGDVYRSIPKTPAPTGWVPAITASILAVLISLLIVATQSSFVTKTDVDKQLSEVRHEIYEIQKLKAEQSVRDTSALNAPSQSFSSSTSTQPSGYVLDITGPVDCWVEVTTDSKSKVISLPIRTSFVSKVEVRAGCPGKLQYYINGVSLTLKNKSKTPEKSEVVSLP